MRLLDLCCGAGGSAVGYHRAGFEVTGVDIVRQPHYPFPFVQADALTYPLEGFDVVHASPPCQRFSTATSERRHRHTDLVTPMLERLAELEVPWLLENVPGAPLPSPVTVCGAAMGCATVDDDGTPLVLRRHRLFASNVPLSAPTCACARARLDGAVVAGIYGGGPERRSAAGRERVKGRNGYTPPAHVRHRLAGIEWMTRRELSRAIPPAYTEHLGRQLAELSKVAA